MFLYVKQFKYFKCYFLHSLVLVERLRFIIKNIGQYFLLFVLYFHETETTLESNNLLLNKQIQVYKREL